MKSQITILHKNGWKHLLLILVVCFNSCDNVTTSKVVEVAEIQCSNDFLFTIDGASFKFSPHESAQLKWEYFNDPTYDYSNFDMDCECPEFVIDEGDIHYLTFPLSSEKELLISIHKYWVNWTGHDLQPGRYNFSKSNRLEGPQIKVSLRDKESNCLYHSVKGRLHLTHFQFIKCIKGKISVELDGPDCKRIVVSGDFSVNYTGEIKAPLSFANSQVTASMISVPFKITLAT